MFESNQSIPAKFRYKIVLQKTFLDFRELFPGTLNTGIKLTTGIFLSLQIRLARCLCLGKTPMPRSTSSNWRRTEIVGSARDMPVTWMPQRGKRSELMPKIGRLGQDTGNLYPILLESRHQINQEMPSGYLRSLPSCLHGYVK